MAIYRLEAKIIGRKARDKAGIPIDGKQVSIVAKAAYRSGEKLKDERIDKTFNYQSRTQEVVHTEILPPDEIPDWLKLEQGSGAGNVRQQRQRLWNEIERVEKRVDSQLAREFIVSLPKELSKEQRIEIVRHWCRDEFVSKGFVVDFAIHRSRDGQNPHAHILCALRPIDADGFGKKPDMSGKFNGRGHAGLGAKSDLEVWRSSWENAVNGALEAAGRNERVDHRSLKERGIDREPEPKIGVAAMAMKRIGKFADLLNLKTVRRIRLENDVRPHHRDLSQVGEVGQIGLGGTWWERAEFVARREGERVKELLRDESSGSKWHEYAKTRAQQPETKKDVAQPDLR